MLPSHLVVSMVAAASFGGFNFFNWFQAPPPPPPPDATTTEVVTDVVATDTMPAPMPMEEQRGFSFFSPSTWRPNFQRFFGGEEGQGPKMNASGTPMLPPGQGGPKPPIMGGPNGQGGMPGNMGTGTPKGPPGGFMPMGTSSGMKPPQNGMMPPGGQFQGSTTKPMGMPPGQGQNTIQGYMPPTPIGGKPGDFPGDEGASQGMPGMGGQGSGIPGGQQMGGMMPPQQGIPGNIGGGFQSDQGMQGGQMGGQQGGMPPKPPQAAIDACKDKSVGTSCKFTDKDHTVSGSCITPPNMNIVACAPSNMMPPSGTMPQ